MINYLQNCNKNTPIGMIPEIINHNNEAISDEFAWIYDQEHQRLTKSVYAPTGSVKAHNGEFVNLSCEYLTIKNVNTLKVYIDDVIDDIIDENIMGHNTRQGRFSEESGELYYDTQYCHDAAAIVYEGNTTVYDLLDKIDKGDVKFRYKDELYSGEQIATLIEWKKRLVVQPIVVTDQHGVQTIYNVLCDPDKK